MIMSKCVKKYLLNVKRLFYTLWKLYAILENIMQHICERFFRKRRRLQQWIRYISPEKSVTVSKI